MALTLSEVESRIDLLEKKLATGELNVKYETHSVTYRSVDDMYRTLLWLEGKRDSLKGVSSNRSRGIRVVTRSGF